MSDFVSRFSQIDALAAKRLVAQFGSPFYLLDEVGIRERLDQLQRRACEIYPQTRIAISYKTNPTRALLHDLHQSGALAEVVSGDEYQIARSLDVPDSKIIFNGPAKSDNDLRAAITGGCYLHCDHDDELNRIETIAKQMNRVAKVGLRLYFPGEQNWHRFGFQATSEIEGDDVGGRACHASRAIQRIVASSNVALSGFHAHIGTNVRDIGRFSRFAQTYGQFVESAIEQYNLQLGWIDAGGGLAGIAPLVSEDRTEPFPLPSIDEYCRAVIPPLLDCLNRCREKTGSAPVLFLEPGRTLFNAFGGILVTVIGRRPAGLDGIESVILDAGVTCLHFAFKYDLPVHVCKTADQTQAPQFLRSLRLLGPTCMEQDVVCRPILLPDLQPGEQLIIYATGCYSMAMGNSFIRFRPGTVGWQADQQFRWLRMPETVGHSSQLDVMSSNKKSTKERS